MSKSKGKAGIELFCETQCSQSDSDEDYIDQLIRKRGSQALNTMLKDEPTPFEEEMGEAERRRMNQEILNESDDNQEMMQLRDSLITPTNGQFRAETGAILLGKQKEGFTQEYQIPDTSDAITPKGLLMYHKKNMGAGVDKKQASTSESSLVKQSTSSFQGLSSKSSEPRLEIPQDLPDLEHQDTIVRKPSGKSSKGVCDDSVIFDSQALFMRQLGNAIDYFTDTPLQIPAFKQKDESYSKAAEVIQHQLLNENQSLRMEVNRQMQINYQLKAKNKEAQRQLKMSNESKKVADLQNQVNELSQQLSNVMKIYEQERMDKEHTVAAYKRLLGSTEKEKQQWQQMLTPQQLSQSFLSQASSTTNSNNMRKSPSPMRASMQVTPADLSMTQHHVIKQLQDELQQKDNEIEYYRQQKKRVVGKGTQHYKGNKVRMVIPPLHHNEEGDSDIAQRESEENVLEDFEENEEEEYNYLDLQQQHQQQHKLSFQEQQQQFQKMQQQQQYSTYEQRNQSPLGIYHNQSSQMSNLPTSSTTFSNGIFRAERTQSPLPVHNGQQYIAKLQFGGQQTTSSCSSSSYRSSSRQQQQVQHQTFLADHQKKLKSNALKVRKQSPHTQHLYQSVTKLSEQMGSFQGLASNVSGNAKHLRQSTQQYQLTGNDLKQNKSNNFHQLNQQTIQKKHQNMSQPTQYLLTNSSGSSGVSGLPSGAKGLTSKQLMSSPTGGCCRSEDEVDMM